MPKTDYFDSSKFMGMNQMERLRAIHDNPVLYMEELKKRQALLRLSIQEGVEGYARVNNEAEKSSYTGEHSDRTSDVAIRHHEYKVLLNDKATYKELLGIKPESFAEEMLLGLRKSFYLYERVIELFSNETFEILKLRMGCTKLIWIANELGYSRSLVSLRISRSNLEFELKAKEVLEVFCIQ